MTRTFNRALLATACLFLPVAGFAPPAHAQECSISQVAGKWAAWTQGNVNGIGPRVSAGIFTLDTSGKAVNGKATSSLAGTVFHEAFSGNYSVSSDCTGTLAIDIFDASSGTKLFTATIAIYFDDGGKEIRGIFTSAVAVPTPPATNGTALQTEIVLEARKIGES
jgi:hypothetical protein